LELKASQSPLELDERLIIVFIGLLPSLWLMDRQVVLLEDLSVRGSDRGLCYAYKVIFVSSVVNEFTNNKEKQKEDKV
jgi:hypothetical protein